MSELHGQGHGDWGRSPKRAAIPIVSDVAYQDAWVRSVSKRAVASIDGLCAEMGMCVKDKVSPFVL